jgi:hypothetical protein
MHTTLSTMGDLVSSIYEEILVAYENEAMAALVTALLIDELITGGVVNTGGGK